MKDPVQLACVLTGRLLDPDLMALVNMLRDRSKLREKIGKVMRADRTDPTSFTASSSTDA